MMQYQFLIILYEIFLTKTILIVMNLKVEIFFFYDKSGYDKSI